MSQRGAGAGGKPGGIHTLIPVATVCLDNTDRYESLKPWIKISAVRRFLSFGNKTVLRPGTMGCTLEHLGCRHERALLEIKGPSPTHKTASMSKSGGVSFSSNKSTDQRVRTGEEVPDRKKERFRRSLRGAATGQCVTGCKNEGWSRAPITSQLTHQNHGHNMIVLNR